MHHFVLQCARDTMERDVAMTFPRREFLRLANAVGALDVEQQEVGRVWRLGVERRRK